MFLRKISLINYKNISQREIEFSSHINCFVGENGIGKTNMLDAVYHLGMGKSYFNPIASQNIRHGEEFYVIDGIFDKNEKTEQIICSVKKGQKKIIKKNGKAYDKLSEHIGNYPMVIISPADRDLITEGSEVRRKFIDSVISQSDSLYLHNVINYNKVLAQRNSLLKYFAANHTFDKLTLSVYDEQLHSLGTEIYKKREIFIQIFSELFLEQYEIISGGKDSVGIQYQSQLSEDSLYNLLKSNIEKDKILQYTSQGIHKDDLVFEIDNYPIKKYGSQGQQKSFLIALKLAQFELLKKESGTTPILLLDDIFDKLDETRVAQIIKLVSQNSFGQIFITDTHSQRTEEVVKQTEQPYSMIEITQELS